MILRHTKPFLILVIILSIFSSLAYTSLENDAFLESGLKLAENLNFKVWAPTQEEAQNLAKWANNYYKHFIKTLKYGGILKAKCHIYIYPTREVYLKILRGGGFQVEWSSGIHFERTHNSPPLVLSYKQDDLLTKILPHELTHAIFKEFLNPVDINIDIPLWANEGLAVYVEKDKLFKAQIKKYVLKKQFLSLEELLSMDDYPRDEAKLNLFYLQAPSLVDFLISQYGGDKFLSFIKKIANRKMDPKVALQKTYYGKIKDLEDLSSRWQKFIRQNY
jgi:hypothetical protein